MASSADSINSYLKTLGPVRIQLGVYNINNPRQVTEGYYRVSYHYAEHTMGHSIKITGDNTNIILDADVHLKLLSTNLDSESTKKVLIVVQSVLTS